jgi:hypothetical protein
MGSQGFEDLEVYRLAEDIADCVWDAVIPWDNFAKDTVGKQLVRAADSIGANIAEGTGRGTYKDNKHFAKIGRGSHNETRHSSCGGPTDANSSHRSRSTRSNPSSPNSAPA